MIRSEIFLIGIGCAAFLSTMAGGLFAVHFRDKLHLVLGFSAGAVLAVAFFDLWPEAIELGHELLTPQMILSISAVSFFSYLVLDRTILAAQPRPMTNGQRIHVAIARGTLGAVSVSTHSFFDGFAIGIAFQASHAAGTIVTIAVLTHDCSDGMNVVNLLAKNGGSRYQSLCWLLVDAAAPLLGIIASQFVVLPPAGLAAMLAIFSGFFLYIGASELLPESHHAHPQRVTTFVTLLGAGVLYLAVRLAG